MLSGLGMFCTIACAEPVVPVAVRSSLAVHALATQIDTLPGDYTRVVRLVEMSDSVVILSDAADRLAWRIDLATDERVVLGRQGDGPGEYRNSGLLVRVHRDSVALLFGTTAFPLPVLSAVTGAGRTHSFVSIAESTWTRTDSETLSLPRLLWADLLGHVYGTPLEFTLSTDGAGRMMRRARDTLPIVRISLETNIVDTLAAFAVGQPLPEAVQNADGSTSKYIALGPYGAYNSWTANADGRLMLVDAERYELRVLDQSGTERAKWLIPHTAIAASERGWRIYVENAASSASGLLDRTFSRLGLSGGSAARSRGALLKPPMPRTLPPVAFHGELLKRSIHWVGDRAFIPVNLVDTPRSEYWDIICVTSGRRQGTISLPPRHYLLHVGSLGAYVVYRDADDVERVLLFRSATSLGDLNVPDSSRSTS